MTKRTSALSILAAAHGVNYLTAWRRARAGLPIEAVLAPTREQLERRRYGKGIARLIQIRGALNRQIKRARA